MCRKPPGRFQGEGDPPNRVKEQQNSVEVAGLCDSSQEKGGGDKGTDLLNHNYAISGSSHIGKRQRGKGKERSAQKSKWAKIAVHALIWT